MESPDFFTTLNNELSQRYAIIIDEIVKTYPSYKANPQFNAYSQAYEKNISNLEQLQAEYFLFKNTLGKDTEELQKAITGASPFGITSCPLLGASHFGITSSTTPLAGR